MGGSKRVSRILAGLTLAAMLAGPLGATASADPGNGGGGGNGGGQGGLGNGGGTAPVTNDKTTTALTLSSYSMTEGDATVITLTATVTVDDGGTATGNVAFKLGGTTLGTVAIVTVNGSQTATTTYDATALAASVEPYVFHAHYLGSGSFNASNAIAKLAVNARPALPGDATPPIISSQVVGTLGTGGWYVSDVTVTWTVSDGESAVTSSGCEPQTITTDTSATTYTCTATSAGGTSSESVTIKRDATKPAIAYSGATDYTVDQTVAISCSATDATSGLAAMTCPGAAGDAYTFAIGTTTLAASATDRAGNSESASFSFTVRVTADSLCNLTKRFATKTLGNSLCAQLSAAAAAAARGNEKAKANALAAYTREVNAQTGKAFTADRAATLTSLASYLSN